MDASRKRHFRLTEITGDSSTKSGGLKVIFCRYAVSWGQAITGAEYPIMRSSDGSAVYLDSGVFPSRSFRVDLKTGRRQFLKELMATDRVGLQYIQPLFTQDEKTYAYAYWRTLSDLYVIEGLK